MNEAGFKHEDAAAASRVVSVAEGRDGRPSLRRLVPERGAWARTPWRSAPASLVMGGWGARKHP